jgi:hypothetical protein
MMTKNTVKTFLAGAIIGSILVSGIGYASSYLTSIEVNVTPIDVTYNGKKVISSSGENQFKSGSNLVPASFLYKGTTYVPVRLFGEAVGKKIDWDGNTRTVAITDVALENNNSGDTASSSDESSVKGNVKHQVLLNQDFQTVDFSQSNTDIPQEVREWAKQNFQSEYRDEINVNGSTYVLIARGESSSSGYGVNVTEVVEHDNKVVVHAKYANPEPGMSYLTLITYPAVLVKIDQEVTKEIEFEIEG